jgi:hypothetical protein
MRFTGLGKSNSFSPNISETSRVPLVVYPTISDFNQVEKLVTVDLRSETNFFSRGLPDDTLGNNIRFSFIIFSTVSLLLDQPRLGFGEYEMPVAGSMML